MFPLPGKDSIMSGELIPFGYLAPDAESRLDELMARPYAILLDIRFKAWSHRVMWRSGSLLLKYGSNYRTLSALGNVNYKNPGEPHRIANPQYGLQIVGGLLATRQTIILLCACACYERCHRKTVAEMILDTYPETIVVLEQAEEKAVGSHELF
jgi:hypothetical protein